MALADRPAQALATCGAGARHSPFGAVADATTTIGILHIEHADLAFRDAPCAIRERLDIAAARLECLGGTRARERDLANRAGEVDGRQAGVEHVRDVDVNVRLRSSPEIDLTQDVSRGR